MGSLETLKVPVMDFTKPGALNPGSPEWDSLKVQVKEALKEYGCFQALYNKVPEELRKALFSAAEELFDLPTHIKKLNVSAQPFRGYIGQNPTVVEGMGVEGAHVFDEVENFTNTFWPQGNPNFSKTIHSFSRQVVELEKMICRMVFESLGVEKYLEKHMDSTDYILKFMKYSPPDQNTASTGPHVGLPSHTDKSTISILYDNEVGGLEIQNKNGDWINVQLSPDTFLVITGDVFHAWSNGLLQSPYHRVTKRGGKETRYSAQLFSTPKEGYLVKVPEELVDEQHPLLFKPFCQSEYTRFCAASHASGKGDATITDYCGI
ncbi:probable 2-oxoglutarate-dependent dioxygenase AOP1 [Tripterygium wilfordii]|uniref:probable 2-oxoglutarate-dependent dioxygenase AOP1 n=1 Tax=Tripterygium wilfordii TaxID=458696 RepID=UPI0018F85C89|nr:probable 2-oxoglutarate-dependent dioxygenase AOP1 [Tripterygium wilfordii]